jgi:hypothetical protein
VSAARQGEEENPEDVYQVAHMTPMSGPERAANVGIDVISRADGHGTAPAPGIAPSTILSFGGPTMKRLIAVCLALPFAVATLAGCPAEEAQEPLTPSTLEAPAKGQGFQFKTELFAVDPGTEVQDC